MFWKKKNHSEALIFLESHEARSSFRVCPPFSEPIRIQFRGQSVPVENIGAAGIAFPNKGFKRGDSQRIVLDLPGEDTTLSVTAEIIHMDPNGTCHCRFVGLSEDDRNAIHRYMLAVQLREVRGKKRAVGRMRQSQNPAGPGKSIRGASKKLLDSQGAYPRPQRPPAHCK